MKAIFHLKEEPQYIPINMTNEQAEIAYRGSYKYPSRINRGFISEKLTFIKWLILYNIKII